MSVEDVEKRRALRREETAKKKAAQYEKDLDALDALEAEHGEECVAALEVPSFKEGLPTIVVVKSPGGTSFYARYKGIVRRAGKSHEAIGAAQEMLGESCIAYPADDAVKKALFEAFPGTALSAAVRVLKFVELEEADEKKG